MNGKAPLMAVRGLYHRYAPARDRGGERWALAGVDLTVGAGETVAVVGASGAGKTTLARLAVGLFKPTRGSIWFAGKDLARLSERELRPLRPALQMIFQDAGQSLDPRLTVQAQVEEPLLLRGVRSKAERRQRVLALLDRVGLEAALMARLPGELSGGQRQRVAIARALALDPHLLVADEPLAALDSTAAAQVLDLMADLQAERGLAYLLVAHRLALVRALAHRVAVMLAGRLVEAGPAAAVLEHPVHPYTQRLVAAEAGGEAAEAPALTAGPGCAFASACPWAVAACARTPPALRVWEGRAVACHGLPAAAGDLDPLEAGMV